MRFLSLYLTNFKCFDQIELKSFRDINLFFGVNGVGKTSLLESFYFLSTGKSFVSKNSKDLIAQNQLECVVRAELEHPKLGNLHIGVSRHRVHGVKAKVNNRSITCLSELARLIPVQIFQPSNLNLMIGAPKDRRKFFNWGVFHHDLEYLDELKAYEHCIKQRQALFLSAKSSEDTAFSFWDVKIAEIGESIQIRREKYFKELSTIFLELVSDLLPHLNITLLLDKGWKDSLKDALASHFKMDFKYKNTSVGPHRFDLKIIKNENDSIQSVSRGELKILHSALFLAQIKVFNEFNELKSVLLFDDISSELDDFNQETVLDTLFNLCEQVFLSSLLENKMIKDNRINGYNVSDLKGK